MTDLRTSLSVPDDGILCAVGAGGKKTTLYRLAAELERAIVTATVRIPIFDDHVERVVVTEDPVAARASATAWPLGLVAAQDRPDRYTGYEPERVDDLGAAHDGPVLVKADGARVRLLKAPGEREPRIPRTAETVLALASAHAVGEPLDDEAVHRPERVARVTGRELDAEIRPRDVGRVLASDAGGLKGVPSDATAIPVVNMVDDEGLETVAREVAETVLAETDRVDRVVLTRMVDTEPVVAVVTR